jgi:thymidylate synthase (FAD)
MLSPEALVMIGAACPRRSQTVVPPSLRRGIGVWTSMQRTRLIAQEDDCYRCLRRLPRGDLQLDHVVPVAEDLRKALDDRNLAPICEPCHKEKSAAEQGLATRTGKVVMAKPVALRSVVADGVDTAYSIEVQGPWANCLANGIVVRTSSRLSSDG